MKMHSPHTKSKPKPKPETAPTTPKEQLFHHLLSTIHAMKKEPFRSHTAFATLAQQYPESYRAAIESTGGDDYKTKASTLHMMLAKRMRSFPEIEKIGTVKKSLNAFGNRSKCGLWKKKD